MEDDIKQDRENPNEMSDDLFLFGLLAKSSFDFWLNDEDEIYHRYYLVQKVKSKSANLSNYIESPNFM